MDRQFPILPLTYAADEDKRNAAGFSELRSIPWAIIAPHEKQALRNHNQSLETLAKRCGLSACEAVAVLEDRPWREMDIVAAYRRLDALIHIHSQP